MSFGLPGSIFLVILSGPIFGGYWPGFFISAACSVTGASVCFHMSKHLGSGVLESTMPDKLNWMREKVHANRNSLFYYFLFLRFTPLVPNNFVNLSAGIVGFPFYIFFAGSCLGACPYHLILVQLGYTLKEITTFGIGTKNVAILAVLGFVSLIPTYFVDSADKMENQLG